MLANNLEMASGQHKMSSGSVDIDEKRKNKMIYNREWARRSRTKKKRHFSELIAEISQLQSQNKVIMSKINEAKNMLVGVASENNVMRNQLSELTNEDHSLNSYLHYMNEVSNFTTDVPQITGDLIEPWQFPRPGNMFDC